ncbi:TPA: hypothetical protein HA253_06380, partial [Candidatus Woesearchaeota archaeon]|nr:hypothetical protein [Candidatus Woesearchaeota archaeon]
MKESGQSVQSSQGVMPITQEQYGKDAGLVATTLFGSLVAEKRSLQPRYYWGAADLDELGLTLQTIQEIEEDIDDFRDLTTHATALDLRGLLSGYQETERQKGISEETARDKRRKKLAGNENVFSIMPISDYRPSQMVAERYFNHPSGTPLTSSEIDEVLQDEIEDIIQARTSTQPIAVEHRSSSDYLSPNDQAELQRTRAIIGQYAQTARKLHESSWDEAKKKQPDRLIEEGHPVDNFLNNLPDQLRERRRQEAMSQARRARAEREAQEKAQQQAEVAEGREVVKLESPRVAEVPEIRHGAQLEESPSPLTFESPRIHQEPRTFEATVTQAPDVVVLTEPSQQSREKRIEAEITGAQPKVDLVSPRQVTLEKAHQAQIEGHPDVVKLEVLRVGDRAEVVHEADLSPVAERVELHEPHQVRHEVTAREATVQEASSPVHLEPLVMGEPEARTIEATLAPSEGPVTFQRPEQGQRQAQKKDAQLSPSAEGVTFEAPQPGLHGKEVTNAEISPTQEPLTLSIPNHKDGDLSTHDARLSEASALVDLHEPYAARPTVAPQEAVIHEVSGP